MSLTGVATLNEIADTLARQIEAGLADQVPGLQVVGRRTFNPTPPCIDVYPAPDAFLTQIAFRFSSQEAVFVIRARVSTADHDAGADLLNDLLDPRGDLSLVAVVAADPTLGGAVDDSTIEGANGHAPYQDVDQEPVLLGCEWRIRVEL